MALERVISLESIMDAHPPSTWRTSPAAAGPGPASLAAARPTLAYDHVYPQPICSEVADGLCYCVGAPSWKLAEGRLLALRGIGWCRALTRGLGKTADRIRLRILVQLGSSSDQSGPGKEG
jgi:hypothetical protein